MRNKLILFGVISILLVNIGQAQSLQRMEVSQLSAPEQGVAVFMDYPDKAAIIIESPLTSLRFSSNMNGIVREMHEPERGRYVLIVEPFTQILVVDSPGFIQQRQRIGSPQPREVRYFEVKPKERASELISVIFNVTPSDARLFINGQETSVNQTTQLAPGSVEVRLEREGYRTIIDAITVNSSNILFTYNLEEINLVPVRIQSNVEGASVEIDGTVRGQIDRGGGLGLFLYPGTYALSISETGYVTQNLTLEVSEEGENEVLVELERNVGELSLQVQPAKAQVSLNRQDYSGQSLIELAPGRYRLDVELQGYEPYSENIEIALNERTNVQVDLERNVGELALQIQPSNARVSLNRQDYSGHSLIELAPGLYRLDVELQGYESHSETIEIALNEQISRGISLQPFVGSLQFNVTPSNTQVQLLNKSGDVVNEWTGIQLLRNLKSGTYTLRATADGYMPKMQGIDIQKDQITQVNINLEEGTLESLARDSQTKIVDVTNPETGRVWMDRNLGASRAATSSSDAEAYGDLYQWGRSADGHQKRNSSTTTRISRSNQPNHGDFILKRNLRYSFRYDWLSPQNENLWQGANGINNPCPNGYRLPTEAEWESEIQSWNSKNAAGAFSSQLKLPVAGARAKDSGAIYNVSGSGRYWSSSVDHNKSQILSFSSNTARVISNYRSFGFSVRCIKD